MYFRSGRPVKPSTTRTARSFDVVASIIRGT
jgi:hypothetical protein